MMYWAWFVSLLVLKAELLVDHVSHFSASELWDNPRAYSEDMLQRRSEGELSDKVLLEFEGLGKRFGILLEPHDSLLPADSTVRIHKNGAVEELPVMGKAYIGTRLAVLRNSTDTNIAVMMMSRTGGFTSDAIVEDPFAHFYMERDAHGTLNVQGGFIHEGQFYQVNHDTHPVKPKVKTVGGAEKLVVSMQPVEEATAFGEHLDEKSQTNRSYKCGHDMKPWNVEAEGATQYFMDALVASKGNSTMSESRLSPRGYNSGCPVNRKTLLVGIVADCNYVRAFQGNRGQIQTSLIHEFSLVSGIYEKAFNINIGILSIELMNDCDSDPNSWNSQCKPMHFLGNQMSKFSKYRESLRKDVGVYHLVTDCLHTEVVGIAWLNQVCRTDTFMSGKDYVSGTSASTLIKNHFSVIAHEIAHNLGASHDCNKELCSTCSLDVSKCDCCPCGSKCDCNDKFIMSPGSGTVDVREFSPCSLQQVCSKIPILATCLADPGSRKTIKLGQCGNGIREEGEECDCGSPEQCAKDPCCMEGCKLRKNATCSDNNDPCCRECKIIPAGERFVCAKSAGFCQFSSVCQGERECPLMKTRPNGTPCKEIEGGRCSAGICTSRDAQCKAIGGQLGVKKACDTLFNDCNLVCQGPNDRCLSFKSTFSDGVACGSNGFCKDGACSESIVVTAVTKYWLGVVIVGGLFLAAMFACVLATCRS